jgi:hypothetical protein
MKLLLRYLVRSSVSVTVRTVQTKIYEILDFLEEQLRTFIFTSIECIGPDGPTLEQCLEAYEEDFEGDQLICMETQGIQIFTIPETAVFEIEARGAGSLNDKAVGAIIKGKIELKKGEKIHIAIGQQGLHNQAGNGGTFIARKVNNVFEPVIVAGGAAGTSDGIEPENILMANGRTDQFGGNSSLFKNINKNIRSSGESYNGYAGGAGFHVSPSVEYLNKKVVGDVPKCFKDGLRGGILKKGYAQYNGGFGGGGMNGIGGGGGYAGGNGGGGGGGSFNSDPDGENSIGNLGSGKCTFRVIPVYSHKS